MSGTTRQQQMAERRRSGSERRRRDAIVPVRLLDQEREALRARAEAAGLTLGAYLRQAGLGYAGMRARHTPRVNAVLLSQAIAALNKAGSNLNQIARRSNYGMGIDPEAAQTISETRAAVQQIVAATRGDHP